MLFRYYLIHLFKWEKNTTNIVLGFNYVEESDQEGDVFVAYKHTNIYLHLRERERCYKWFKIKDLLLQDIILALKRNKNIFLLKWRLD